MDAELFHTLLTAAAKHGALSVEGGHLTPTLKVKRKAVYAAFAEQFEALYAAAGAR